MDKNRKKQRGSMLYGEQIFKTISFLKGILDVIGYSEEESDQFIQKFFTAVEADVMEKILRRVTAQTGEKIKAALTGSDKKLDVEKRMNILRSSISSEISEKELQILYSEAIERLMDEYLKAVVPEMSEEEKGRLEGVMSLSNQKST